MRDVTTTTSLEVKGRPYWKKYRTEVVPGQGSMSGLGAILAMRKWRGLTGRHHG